MCSYTDKHLHLTHTGTSVEFLVDKMKIHIPAIHYVIFSEKLLSLGNTFGIYIEQKHSKCLFSERMLTCNNCTFRIVYLLHDSQLYCTGKMQQMEIS